MQLDSGNVSPHFTNRPQNRIAQVTGAWTSNKSRNKLQTHYRDVSKCKEKTRVWPCSANKLWQKSAQWLYLKWVNYKMQKNFWLHAGRWRKGFEIVKVPELGRLSPASPWAPSQEPSSASILSSPTCCSSACIRPHGELWRALWNTNAHTHCFPLCLNLIGPLRSNF